MFRRLMPLAALFLVAQSGEAFAAPALALLSRTLLEGPARAVAFAGRDVLVGTGCGVAIVADGDEARTPAYLPLEGQPAEIIANGSLAYVAASDGGLVVIDLSEPRAPKEIFRYAAIRAERCALAGSTLFVADALSTLHAFDCADPRAPRLIRSTKLEAAVYALAAEGDLLAIVHPRATAICRVARDGTTRELSEAALEEDAAGGRDARAPRVTKKGIVRRGLLLVLTSTGEILCWDIGRPERPVSLGPMDVKGAADVAAGNDEGIILTGLGFILPFDIERPAAVGSGARAKLKAGKGFTLESVNRYGQPIATGSPAAEAAHGETRTPTAVFMAGARFAVVAPFDGVGLYELERRGARLERFLPTRGFAISVVAAKGLLYAANGFDGVRIGRIGRDGTVDWIGHIQTVEARDVALGGPYLFIADGGGGLKVADVSDPANAKIVGRHESPFFLCALVVAGGRAYCAGGLGGAEIVDVAEPQRPKLVWRREFSEVRGIDADARYLYLSDGYKGCRIYALGGAEPAEVSVLRTPGWNCDCFVSGNVAYLADGGAGIAVANVSNRNKPRILGSLSLGTVARAVQPLGKTLFVAAQRRGVAAIDVSNPKKPAVAGWYDTADDARGIFADADFVYAASGSGGVYVFKYSR
jgi:hypothetical protein